MDSAMLPCQSRTSSVILGPLVPGLDVQQSGRHYLPSLSDSPPSCPQVSCTDSPPPFSFNTSVISATLSTLQAISLQQNLTFVVQLLQPQKIRKDDSLHASQTHPASGGIYRQHQALLTVAACLSGVSLTRFMVAQSQFTRSHFDHPPMAKSMRTRPAIFHTMFHAALQLFRKTYQRLRTEKKKWQQTPR